MYKYPLLQRSLSTRCLSISVCRWTVEHGRYCDTPALPMPQIGTWSHAPNASIPPARIPSSRDSTGRRSVMNPKFCDWKLGLLRKKWPIRIAVEVWGERLYPLVVGTFWLGLPPQHYKNHNHPQSDSLQIPRLASIQKGYPSIQWVSKTTIKWSSKTGELFVAGQFCCRTRPFFPHIPGLKSCRNIKALQKQFPNLGKGSKVACLQKVGDPTCWTRNKQVVEKALVQEICPTFL